MSSKEVKLMDTNEVFAIINERLKLSDPMGASLDSCISVTELLSILSNAPTIDPESLLPHGRWKVVQINGTCTTFACSECSREVKATNDYFGKPTEHIAEKSPYCHCGAKMEVDNV